MAGRDGCSWEDKTPIVNILALDGWQSTARERHNKAGDGARGLRKSSTEAGMCCLQVITSFWTEP